MESNLLVVINTPWKLGNELLMYALKPIAYLYLRFIGVDIEQGYKFYGLPKIYRHRLSKINIGKNYENRNFWSSNPLGINHPTILCTWGESAKIKIGHDVGISGGSIVASRRIEIGNGTLIGANCTIIDTDFHPVDSRNRRYDKNNIKSSPVKIGANVFIGMNTTILKGANIPDNTVVPACSLVRRSTKFSKVYDNRKK